MAESDAASLLCGLGIESELHEKLMGELSGPEKVKVLLKELEATLIDNVVLIDKGSSLETFITTPRWM